MEALKKKDSVGGGQNLVLVKGAGEEYFRIERLPGLDLDPAGPWHEMQKAVERHMKETGDMDAAYGVTPLTYSQAAAMMDFKGIVSGYRLVRDEDTCRTGDLNGLLRMLRMRLTVAPLENVQRDKVWAQGDSTLYYIRGWLD